MQNNEQNIDFYSFSINSLEKIYSVFSKKFDECKNTLSEDSIHDARVTTRRFRALLALLIRYYDTVYSKKLRKELKIILELLNPLRDIQVQIIAVKKMISKLPVLSGFLSYLNEQEKDLSARIGKEIIKIDKDCIEGLVFFLKFELKNKYHNKIINISEFKLFVRESYDDVINKRQNAIPSQLRTIHNLRLSFKKYRYTCEFFKTILEIDDNKFKRMKGYQNILGSIQDNSVLLGLLQGYLKESKNQYNAEFIPIVTKIINKRTKLVFNLMTKHDYLTALEVN